MISIIIPTCNEADQIASTIYQLKATISSGDFEIIVADAGSSDDTIKLAKKAGAAIVISPRKGRAVQMNAGATAAKGDIFYFLHADTIPADKFIEDIIDSINKGYHAGCFMLSFDYEHWFLKANCWFTHFDFNAIRFGDQSLFVTKAAFDQAGGFSEEHIIMEDQHLIKRLRTFIRFRVIKKPVITSARKYLKNGIYKTQGIFFIIYFMYVFGFSQDRLLKTYKKMISQDKL